MMLGLDIQAAIEKNLSSEVGEVLKKRLSQAEVDAAACTLYKEKVEKLQNQIENLQKQVKSQEELDGKFKQLVATNADVEKKLIRAEIYDLKVEHAKERVADMKSLVALVFQNNQYKYSTAESGMLPAGCDQYGNPRTSNYSRGSTGTGEGAPPPPPIGSP